MNDVTRKIASLLIILGSSGSSRNLMHLTPWINDITTIYTIARSTPLKAIVLIGIILINLADMNINSNKLSLRWPVKYRTMATNKKIIPNMIISY